MENNNSAHNIENILTKLARLHADTTKGPWVSYVEGRDHESGSDFIMTGGDDIELSGAKKKADQDFIAYVHTVLPQLLTELKPSK